MNLTVEQIEKDIAGFEQRIQIAREKLGELPAGYLPYPEHKKRKKQRRDLQAEIEHVQKMIGYAKEALMEVPNEKNRRQRNITNAS